MDLVHDPERRRYYFEVPEGEAYVTYVDSDGSRVLDYSYVSPSLRGTGIASQLVRQTFEMVMEEGIPSYPACSYIRFIATRNPTWRAYFIDEPNQSQGV